jgi:hypothetical protein
MAIDQRQYKNDLVNIIDNLLTEDMIKELYTFMKLTSDSEKVMCCLMILVTGDSEFLDVDHTGKDKEHRFNWKKV